MGYARAYASRLRLLCARRSSAQAPMQSQADRPSPRSREGGRRREVGDSATLGRIFLQGHGRAGRAAARCCSSYTPPLVPPARTWLALPTFMIHFGPRRCCAEQGIERCNPVPHDSSVKRSSRLMGEASAHLVLARHGRSVFQAVPIRSRLGLPIWAASIRRCDDLYVSVSVAMSLSSGMQVSAPMTAALAACLAQHS